MKNDQEIFKLATLLMIEIPLFSCKLAMFDQKIILLFFYYYCNALHLFWKFKRN